MSKLVDCPSCGGLLPAGRSCCPHCHCRYSPWRRLLLLAAAAFGLGGCSSPTVVHYGTGPVINEGTDMAVQDLGEAPDGR